MSKTAISVQPDTSANQEHVLSSIRNLRSAQDRLCMIDLRRVPTSQRPGIKDARAQIALLIRKLVATADHLDRA